MNKIIPLLIFLFAGIAQINATEKVHLTIRIVNVAGNPIAARVWIEAGEKGQRVFTPEGPESITVYEKDRSFSCDGRFTLEIPRKQPTQNGEMHEQECL